MTNQFQHQFSVDAEQVAQFVDSMSVDRHLIRNHDPDQYGLVGDLLSDTDMARYMMKSLLDNHMVRVANFAMLLSQRGATRATVQGAVLQVLDDLAKQQTLVMDTVKDICNALDRAPDLKGSAVDRITKLISDNETMRDELNKLKQTGDTHNNAVIDSDRVGVYVGAMRRYKIDNTALGLFLNEVLQLAKVEPRERDPQNLFATLRQYHSWLAHYQQLAVNNAANNIIIPTMPSGTDKTPVGYMLRCAFKAMEANTLPTAAGSVRTKHHINLMVTMFKAYVKGVGVDVSRVYESPFKVGESYPTLAGDMVKFVSVHNEGTDYETMADENGVHRYTRRQCDYGRVTASAHDYSHQGNTPPFGTVWDSKADKDI